ncbi:LysE family translocator [Gammaproteobacteria bacterium]|jgi:threonine/homoserine/homoserine lactone efflux protein|nr:LysE family translocator [Gammaproteobacteria bacterium]MDA9259813.1 LysE family translocator [Gammaproteobacteria bacterium]MDB4000386.1 LysE family translocator [Gammaproteobacteria bacterium]MDB4094758.1 LysE family translocator [Gammaproteobacteria bacterium]MDB9837931.1 LysE family translocator [Gammaproteobacteria bacterium]
MFLSAAIAHLLAVMSPGPDTAIIFQQSFAKGRNSGMLTALGIGFGIFLHCLLAISGISILLYSTEEARFVIKILGASYLIFVGFQSLLLQDSSEPKTRTTIFTHPFLIGLITNILNIKAFLFTVSLFSFINLQPDSLMSWIYLFYFPVITAAWFSFVSYALTHDALGDIFNQYNPKIQFASSAFILALGLLIFLQTIYGIL